MGLFKPIPEEKREVLKEKHALSKEVLKEKREVLKEKHALSNSDRRARVSFSFATYLGGLPEDPRSHSLGSTLYANDELVGLGSLGPKKQIVRWAECTGVTVDGGQVAKSKVGAELAFGVLGGLGAKGATDRAFLSVYRNDGAAACYQIDKKSPQAVRAQLTALLVKVGVPFLDGPLAQTTATIAVPISVADELAKLAALRDQGVLTPEEFDQQKANMLSK